MNNIMQIKATFSEDGEYIICGSETGNVFIWKTRGWGAEDTSASGLGSRGAGGFLFGKKKDRDANYFSFLPGTRTSSSHTNGNIVVLVVCFHYLVEVCSVYQCFVSIVVFPRFQPA